MTKIQPKKENKRLAKTGLLKSSRGIRNVMITVTGVNGESLTVVSSAFGYYRFTDVPAGGTYIFSVHSKRYTFSQPTLVRSIVEDAGDIILRRTTKIKHRRCQLPIRRSRQVMRANCRFYSYGVVFMSSF